MKSDEMNKMNQADMNDSGLTAIESRLSDLADHEQDAAGHDFEARLFMATRPEALVKSRRQRSWRLVGGLGIGAVAALLALGALIMPRPVEEGVDSADSYELVSLEWELSDWVDGENRFDDQWDLKAEILAVDSQAFDPTIESFLSSEDDLEGGAL